MGRLIDHIIGIKKVKEQEKILLKVVRDFVAKDDGDPIVLPQFSCSKYCGVMYP